MSRRLLGTLLGVLWLVGTGYGGWAIMMTTGDLQNNFQAWVLAPMCGIIWGIFALVILVVIGVGVKTWWDWVCDG